VTTQAETAAAVPAVRAEDSVEPGNVLGRMTALTLFTPVRRQWRPILRAAFWLGKWAPLAASHILKFDFIHYVRWTVVRDFPYDGPPQPGREKLNYSYLLFESNFDGPWQHYIDAFAYVIPADIRFVWGRGVNFPGPPPAEPLKNWIAANSMEGGSYYFAYPDAGVKVVKAALALRGPLEELAARAAQLGPEEFKSVYERFLTGVQESL
jgi:hypothetical protein